MKQRLAILTLAALAFSASSVDAQERSVRYEKRHAALSARSPATGICPTTSRGVRVSRSYGRDRAWGRRPVQPYRVWVPGAYRTVSRQVWVPGRVDRVWVEPRYEVRLDPCGLEVRVLVCAGYYDTVEVPGRYETRREQEWVPGHWTYR